MQLSRRGLRRRHPATPRRLRWTTLSPGVTTARLTPRWPTRRHCAHGCAASSQLPAPRRGGGRSARRSRRPPSLPATPVTRHGALERCLRLCVCICVCMCARMDVPSSEDASLGFVRSCGSASNKPPRLSLSLQTVPQVPTSSLRPPSALASLLHSVAAAEHGARLARALYASVR